MKTFKVTKTKTQTFKPTNIKSLTEFNGAIAAGVNAKVLTKLPVESCEDLKQSHCGFSDWQEVRGS